MIVVVVEISIANISNHPILQFPIVVLPLQCILLTHTKLTFPSQRLPDSLPLPFSWSFSR